MSAQQQAPAATRMSPPPPPQQQQASAETAPKMPQPQQAYQPTESEEYFNNVDEYEDYDDWAVTGKMSKQEAQRGGGNGSGSIYSAKHTRMRAARNQNGK